MAWEALGSAPLSWSDVLAPPEELTAFLASIKVPQHAAVLADLGYDQVPNPQRNRGGRVRKQ